MTSAGERDRIREPDPSRLALDDPHRSEILAAHEAALAARDAGYADPVTGLFVFTAASLSERPCCDNGCRHCPYV
jgi:hypothetical protein